MSGCQTQGGAATSASIPASKLYVAKCAKCHKMYPPENYSAMEWQDWMFKMKRKSKLTDEAYQRLLDYTHELRMSGSNQPSSAR